MSTFGKSILATSAAALLLSLGTASIAQAGPNGPKNFKNGQGMPKSFHPHHHHFGFGPAFVIGGGYGGYGSYGSYSYGSYGSYGCGYYKRMFWQTGNYYWKAKYYDCLY